jgi:hypothetical protein
MSESGAELLMNESTVRDFIADAFAHLKFIAYVDAALSAIERAGIDEEDIDDGCVELSTGKSAKRFVEARRRLRFGSGSPLSSRCSTRRKPHAKELRRQKHRKDARQSAGNTAQ